MPPAQNRPEKPAADAEDDALARLPARQGLLLPGAGDALEIPFAPGGRRPVRMRLAVKEFPRALLAGEPAAPAGVVLREASLNVVRVPHVQLPVSKAPKNVHVKHDRLQQRKSPAFAGLLKSGRLDLN